MACSSPDSNLVDAHVKDGLSNTLLISEVHAWQPYTRNGGPSSRRIPEDTAEAARMVASGAQFKNTGHTEWPDGRVHHTGFTATMPPNSRVPYTSPDGEVSADYNSWQEGKNGKNGSASYAIITSRSHHPGLVQVAMSDGSVRAVTDDVEPLIWRHSATRAGKEIRVIEAN